MILYEKLSDDILKIDTVIEQFMIDTRSSFDCQAISKKDYIKFIMTLAEQYEESSCEDREDEAWSDVNLEYTTNDLYYWFTQYTWPLLNNLIVRGYDEKLGESMEYAFTNDKRFQLFCDRINELRGFKKEKNKQK